MKLFGKLFAVIGLLGIIFSAAMQVYLNFIEFGTWYSGYIIIHWSLIGFLGVGFVIYGLKTIQKAVKKRRLREKISRMWQKEENSANGELENINK